MITGKLYDWLKLIAQIFLPTVGTLYFAFSENLPKADTVVGTIIAVDLFLGVVLYVSQGVYAMKIGRGDLVVGEDENGADGMRLILDHTPEELAKMKEVRFKVKKRSSEQRSG